MIRRFLVCLAIAWAIVAPVAQTPPARDPILILMSYDGWRWDYMDRLAVPNLEALAARGVRATELIPSFPSFTFPNHYSIVTGLYPAHHGIVANTFADPAYLEPFKMSADTAKNPRWWEGEPIWVTAIRQGRRAGTMFWPGSEVAIGGVRPTYWLPYSQELSSPDRVTQVLDWLALPEAERPAFVSLYFDEVDTAGHEYGPDSPELAAAVRRLDDALGQLVAGVHRLGLDDRTTVVAVSDHGMAPSAEDRLIFLDDYIDLKQVDVIDTGEFLQVAPRTGTVDAVYRQLFGKDPHLTIYTREQLPARFHYRDNARIAPIIGLLDEGWILTSHEREAARKPDAKPRRGAHGYDPQLRSMHGLFVAAGPALRQGLVVAPFENVHIYDFMCAVMRLTPATNDGNPSVTRAFLR